MSDQRLITNCPSCSQKLRVPTNKGDLKITCPKCDYCFMLSKIVDLPLNGKVEDMAKTRNVKADRIFSKEENIDAALLE